MSTLRAAIVVSLVVLSSPGAVSPATPAPSVPSPAGASKVLLYAAGGLSPDLVERYVSQGVMPAFAQLRAAGTSGDNGMVQAFPPTTGTGWHTLATGSWPGEHGVTGDAFHRPGVGSFNDRALATTAGVLQADTLAAAAERAGKKVALLDWYGGSAAQIAGPTVDGVNYLSTRGVLAAPLAAAEQAGAAAYGLSYQVAAFVAAEGWTNVPVSYTPAVQATLTVTTTFAGQNPTRTYDLYVFDGTNDGVVDYDGILVVRSGAGKDGAQASALVRPGAWAAVSLRGADGLIGTRAGQAAGFYLKLVALAPDLSALKLYFTSVARGIANCTSTVCDALPAGGAGESRLEKHIAEALPPAVGADAAPLEAGIVDEDTFVEQALGVTGAYHRAVIDDVLGNLQPDTQLALVGLPESGNVAAEFLGLLTPTDLDGAPNPSFDDRDGDGTPDGRAAQREAYLAAAYGAADALLARARQLMGTPTTFATSDHGLAPQWLAVNASRVLTDAGLQGTELPAGCRADASDLAKACWSGATAHVYVNSTLPSGTTYGQVRSAVLAAFQGLTDPGAPGRPVVLRLLEKEELRNVDGSDSLHPSRSGDVVVVLRPPYQFAGPTPGQRIAPSRFFGGAGYLPELVDLASGMNMHATFVAAGPGIRQQSPVAGIRAVDVAPTIAYLLDVPGPLNARGRILFRLLATPGLPKELTVFSIGDFHGQLTPLSDQPDLSAGPSFAIGGAAYLKPWLDLYRSEAMGGSITVAPGDSTGATPPISSFFGDVPTIELMNLMGFDAAALGNHDLDRGQTYLRSVLVPPAHFRFLSANVVGTTGKTPAEWAPSATFDLFDGTKLGLVGFSNADLASLVPGGALAPFVVTNPLDAVKAEAARLRAKKVGVVVALGHLGAKGGTVTAPTGPLADFADAVTGVDAVIGGDTEQQVASRRVNGVMAVENPDAGTRFTRLRLVFDPSRKTVYRSADFHKPWDIGVTPDAAIQARLEELAAQLAPIMNTVIASSTVVIPRADACGRFDGRTCESLVGDLVADAMRHTYGVDFALTNAGGFRADLTCPSPDVVGDFCPAYAPPPYLITRGQAYAVLPFGNVVTTYQLSGAELKAMLENGVSLMPVAQGRFPQVSGLCFTYDIAKPAGSRVTAVVRQAADGKCTGPAVDLTAASNYFMAGNDFISTGGDGYPNFAARMSTRGVMDQVTADYLVAHSPLAPAIQGRIVCTTSGATPCP